MTSISFEDIYSIFENKIKERQEKFAEEEKNHKKKTTIELKCPQKDKNVLKNKFRNKLRNKTNPNSLGAFSCFCETLLCKEALTGKKPLNNGADFYPIELTNGNGIQENPSFETGCILLEVFKEIVKDFSYENFYNKISSCRIELCEAYYDKKTLRIDNLLELLSAHLQL